MLLAVVEPEEGGFYWGARAEYFFDDTFKVGTSWSDGLEQWAVNAEKFFTRRASASLIYFENPYWSGFEVGGAWRF